MMGCPETHPHQNSTGFVRRSTWGRSRRHSPGRHGLLSTPYSCAFCTDAELTARAKDREVACPTTIAALKTLAFPMSTMAPLVARGIGWQ